jgi:hypothetical protein
VVDVIQAHDLGQHVRVGNVGLRPRGGVPFPVASHRHRVDGVHPVAGRDHGLHPRTPVGLDTDLDLRWGVGRIDVGPLGGYVLGDQRVQSGDAVEAFG